MTDSTSDQLQSYAQATNMGLFIYLIQYVNLYLLYVDVHL